MEGSQLALPSGIIEDRKETVLNERKSEMRD